VTPRPTSVQKAPGCTSPPHRRQTSPSVCLQMAGPAPPFLDDKSFPAFAYGSRLVTPYALRRPTIWRSAAPSTAGSCRRPHLRHELLPVAELVARIFLAFCPAAARGRDLHAARRPGSAPSAPAAVPRGPRTRRHLGVKHRRPAALVDGRARLHRRQHAGTRQTTTAPGISTSSALLLPAPLQDWPPGRPTFGLNRNHLDQASTFYTHTDCRLPQLPTT